MWFFGYFLLSYIFISVAGIVIRIINYELPHCDIPQLIVIRVIRTYEGLLQLAVAVTIISFPS